jgi:multiple sugar transport system ATP-binding protein
MVDTSGDHPFDADVLSCTRDEFVREMRFVKKHFEVLTFADLASGRQCARSPLIITFDDGYKDNMDVAFQVLEDLGIPDGGPVLVVVQHPVPLAAAQAGAEAAQVLDAAAAFAQSRNGAVVVLYPNNDAGHLAVIAEIEERVNEAARILELTEWLDRKPGQLSGGQRQRVAMGRAIVREPAVFLFDEPLSNLDAKMRVEMRKEILQLHRRINTTMIYVTHDQIEAMTLGDRICVMNVGIIEQVGPPTVIFDHPASLFVARFIGTPPMNVFEGSLRAEHSKLIFDGDSLQCALPEEKAILLKGYEARKVCLGIRPRALKLVKEGETPENMFKGIVDISEMLGEEVLVHVTTGDHKYITSINPHQAADLKEGSIQLTPDLSLVHVFDAETGRNLTLPDDVRQKTLPHDTN